MDGIEVRNAGFYWDLKTFNAIEDHIVASALWLIQIEKHEF